MANKVTILCTTYNHEKFICETLDGFVMQKTNFPFEAIVSDDCSTDNNPKIIMEYAEKYPEIIKPVLREKNIGIDKHFFELHGNVKSEYVALCEGDDYWTDPLKLQKQVDFLDAHPECSICFHPVKMFFDDNSIPDTIFPPLDVMEQLGTNIFSINDLMTCNFIQTNSVLYRWRFNGEEKLGNIFPKDILPIDYFLHLLHAQRGKIGFIKDVMANYRRHSGGIWWECTSNPEAHHLRHGIQEIKFYLALEKIFPEYHVIKGHAYTNSIARGFFETYLKHQKFVELKQLMELVPDLFTA